MFAIKVHRLLAISSLSYDLHIGNSIYQGHEALPHDCLIVNHDNANHLLVHLVLVADMSSSLCNLCVLCVSVVIGPSTTHHRVPENTEVAQRRKHDGLKHTQFNSAQIKTQTARPQFAMGTSTTISVPVSAELTIFSVPPIRSARSRMPIRPKCPFFS